MKIFEKKSISELQQEIEELEKNIEEQNNTNPNVEYKIEEIEILDIITKNSTKKFYLTLNNKFNLKETKYVCNNKN